MNGKSVIAMQRKRTRSKCPVNEIPPVPLEAQEQIWLFNWAMYATVKWPELDLLYHIPNGGSRNKIEAAHLKAQGVKKGVPDLFLPVAKQGYHGLYIEMKRQKKGVLSADQKQWIENLRKQGYRVEVCKGFQSAADVIEDYLKGVEK